MNGPTVERTTSLGSRSPARSAVEVTSTSATGRSASRRSARPSILVRVRPTRVGAWPRASSSRSTRCPVYPVAPSKTILRLSTTPLGVVEGRGSAGQSVELADLSVEGPGGDDAAQRADASGSWAGGVAQLRFGVGRCCDDHLGDGGGVVAVLD